MDDGINLPPVPAGEVVSYSIDDMISYASAAVRKDRASRNAPNPAPVVHRARVELTCEQLEKDAARYRWLRSAPFNRGRCFSFDGLSLKCGVELDDAIDSAMNGGQR